MSTTPATTASQLAAIPDDGNRYELVRGELRMLSLAGGQHGRIAMKVGWLLGSHVAENQLGEAFATGTGFLLATDPDTVRAPDAAFLTVERFASVADVRGFLPIAPDLVIEVVSPNDTSSDVEEKAHSWLQFGVRLVLVVDPANQSIRAYRALASIQVYFAGDQVDAADVVEGWTFTVDDVF